MSIPWKTEMETRLSFGILLSFVFLDVEVSAQSDVVLSWQVSTKHSIATFNYTLFWFNELYDCLCNNTTKSCNPSSENGNVNLVYRSTDNRGNNPHGNSNMYECGNSSSPTFVLCRRLQDEETNCSDVERCVSYKRLISSQNISCGLEPVRVIWSSNENVTYWHNDSVLMITSCKPGCDQLQNSSSTPEPQVSTTSLVSSSLIPVTSQVSSLQMSTTSSVSSLQTSAKPSVSSSKSSPIPTGFSSKTSATSPASSTAKVTNNMDDEDDTTIIVAAVVSILAVLAVAVIFGIVLWRRKKKAKAKAARYRTGANAGSNGNNFIGHSEHTNGRDASNATDLNNYSLATISRDGSSSDQAVSVSDPYAKVDLEKKHAARRSAAESTNNEEPQYSECNHHQNYSDIGPPVPLYKSSLNTAGGNTLEDGSSPKFGQNGKTSGNVSNDVSYSDIVFNNTGSGRPIENFYSESDDRSYNNNGDEDDDTEPYRTSGVGGPSRSENPRCETSESSNDPQYSLARDITPGTGNVYSKLHNPVRNIANPYNDLMPDDDSVDNNTVTHLGSEYSRLHDQVRNVCNPYDVLTTNDDLINNRSSV